MCWPIQFTRAPALRARSITRLAEASSSNPMTRIGWLLRNWLSSPSMTSSLLSSGCSCSWLLAIRAPCTKADFWAPGPTNANTGRSAPLPGAACTPPRDGSVAPMVKPARLPSAMPFRTERRSTFMTISSRLLDQGQVRYVLGHLGDGFIIDVRRRKCRHGIEAVAYDRLDISLRETTPP